MNAAALLSLLSVTCLTAAIVVLMKRRAGPGLSVGSFLPLLGALLLYDFIVASNFLEQSQITEIFDPLEDVAEIVFAFLLLLFVNNWRKDRSEKRFRDLFKLAPLPLAEAHLDGRLKEVNELLAERLQDCYQTTFDKIETMDGWWSLACPEPAERAAATSSWSQKLNRALETDGEIEPLEVEITCSDGSKRYLILGGRIAGRSLLVSFFDITARKRMEDEKEALHERMLQSQKLEAIGTLAGGVAHDFSNMLGAIIGYGEILLEEMEPGSVHRDDVAQILLAAERSTGLTRQLLAFARKQETSTTVFDINRTIEETMKMMQRLMGENIELSWLPGEGPLRAKMDQSQFDQILTNLCVNARDAIADVGRVTVETRRVTVDEDYLSCNPAAVPGTYVLVSFSDNGCGMKKETLDHIFEPFYTTKGLGKGTGLGLATVYGVVKQNQGMIDVYSEPGVGTTFNIYLPLHTEEETESAKVDSGDDYRGRGECVLVVEDNPIVLEMSVRMLGLLGYVALSASSPARALELAAEPSNKIEVLMTDVIMPEMNGRDLADRITRLRPEIGILFMSGYAANIIDLDSIRESGKFFVKKPFSRRELAHRLREVLSESDRPQLAPG